MAPVVTAVVDQPALRVSVSLSGVTPDGPVEVWRVHTDGTRDRLRGLPDVSGGVSQVYDYLAPYTPVAGQVQFRYELTLAGTLYVSPWRELVSAQARLRSASLPGTEATFAIAERISPTYTRPQEVLQPIGRATPIVQSGVRQAGRFALSAMTRTLAEAAALRQALSMSSTLLLQMPTELESYLYVAVGDVTRAPVGRVLGSTTLHLWSLDCTVVDAPPGGIVGDPSASYQALVDKGWTYQQMLDWRGTGATTYLDVIKGGY